MTKEDFVLIFNNELDKLQQQLSEARQRVNYFQQINVRNTSFKSKEQSEAEYELSLISVKMNSIRSFFRFPVYARVQAMSDIEIEQFKKEKIAELGLKIEELKAKEAQEKEKFAQLKVQQQEHIKAFGSISDDERNKAMWEGQKLQTEINRYNSGENNGVFPTIIREIKEVEVQQEQMQTKTSQVIKKEMTAEMSGVGTFIQELERISKYGFDQLSPLLATVADDPEKAQKMANLLANYASFTAAEKKVKAMMYLNYGLPKQLERILTANTVYYNAKEHYVTDPKMLTENVEKFEKEFNQAKKVISEYYTISKLEKLVGKEYEYCDSQVDMSFIESQSDKISASNLAYFQALVEKRNNLSKKIFKSSEVKTEIVELNESIRGRQTAIYRQIIGGYKSQYKDVLGYATELSFNSVESLQYSLEAIVKEIETSEKAINELKTKSMVAKREIENQKQDLETTKNVSAGKIRDLAGPQYAETEIPYSTNDSDYNLREIIGSASDVYQVSKIKEVQQEAQNQADIREAELRGISLEQLMQMRVQVKPEGMMEVPIEINNNDSEEFTGGMKM